jgi:FlaA1/EpsC-like NDP-sugar epimerase
VSALLGDVTDEAAVERVFSRERPDVILHAAAQKHVPLSESNVATAVLANVRGTRLVAEAAARHGAGTFVFISTDKAVDPSSVMGATKRVGELVVQQIGSEAAGRFVLVRFGNVLGSQGSVLDLFRQQIADGGPVTITHADMTRYFMTIPEAVRLILLAGAVGEPGAIHVLNMGQPIRILDLAHDLIRLSVAGGSKDIQLTFTGLRPGEKLEETLFGPDEEPIPTDYEVLLVARERTPHAQQPARQLALRLEALASAGAEDELRRELTGGRASVSLAEG